jgi:hypothetical protein
MMQQYTSYQLKALQQLADFRSIFYDEGKNVRIDLLERSINSFVELFCQNHFADSDYSIIQKKPNHFSPSDQWISELDIATILKFLTYYIWTNKSHDGYLIRKIKDRTIHKFLERLDKILSENYQQIKIQNNSVFILNASIAESKYKN